MSKLKRTIFFWTLFVLFLITAPVVVLRARGYRFDFSRGVFVYSGSINIKSNPQDINVILNGKISTSKNLDRINSSFNISGLLPGIYNIQVEAPDFQTWSKKTDVHSGLSSEFWNVLLVRNNYERTDYGTEGIEKFFTSPKNKYLAYTEMDNGSLIVKNLNIKSHQIENTFSFPGYSLIPDEDQENIEWSPAQSNHFSIPTVKNDISQEPAEAEKASKKQTKSYFIADISQDSSFNLNDFLGIQNITDVRWDPQDERYLFFLSDSSLYRANITDKTDLTLVAQDVSAFDLSKTNVYYALSSNRIIYKKTLDGKSDPTQTTNNSPEGLGERIQRMIVYDESRIAFLDENDSLFIFNQGDRNEYLRELGNDIQGMHFSDDGKKLLFWTRNEISVYYLRDWNVQPVRQENDLTNITRYIETIRNVQWFNDYEHVIFNVGNYTKIIELDSRDYRNCMDLTRTDTLTPFIIYNAYLEKLFFTDTKDSRLNLYSIDFPENTNLLGL